jgi:hypothetical protein
MGILVRSRSKKIIDAAIRAAPLSWACASYDGKDTRFGKSLQRTVRFDRNVTVFAGRLSKARGQLMLACASGAIFFV